MQCCGKRAFRVRNIVLNQRIIVNFYKLTSLILALIVTCNTKAAAVSNANVSSVQSYTNGTVGIVTDKQSVNPATCGSVAKYVIPNTEEGVNTTFSLLLTAKVSSKPVIIYLHDSLCSSGYPLITSVVLL